MSEDEECTHGEHGYSSNKQAYTSRLRRIEGQVRGIERMVDEDTYCIDIVTQISAASSALRNLSMTLMNDHLHHCVADAVVSEGGGDEKIDEAMRAIQKMMR